MATTPLGRELLRLRERDQAKRRELLERGELWDGYHPEMEQVHRENARALEEVLDDGGWPHSDEVGEEAAEAAWLVALHAIGEPAFQRRCLEQLQEAVTRGQARAAHGAALLDRIRFNERQPQRYGTILDWDEAGRLSPWRLEDPDGLDARRREVGLPSLEESVREARRRAEREQARLPKPYAERQAEILAWARRVGWLED
jgi:hypothetical protein